MLKVCVTGAAGRVAQCFIPLLCNGSIFHDKKIALSLLDLNNEPQLKEVNGLKLELTDCNYDNLVSISTHTDPNEAFKDCDLIVFIGGFPRKPGMERKDLLKINSKIFTEQGLALKNAKEDVKCLVVANPCNTNAKILYEVCKKNGLKVKKENITSLSRLDQDRAEAIYRQTYNIEDKNKKVNIFIWGNHSSSLFIDTIDEEINKNIEKNEEFLKKIQNRGAEIIKAKGTSSTFSAANAARNHLKDWCYGNEKIVSMGIVSEGDYDVTEGLVCSFPIKCKGNWNFEVVKGINLNDGKKERIKKCVEELESENNEIVV
jgi:malate dehydrogenase